MTKCKICGEEKKDNKGLSYHCSTKHGVKYVDYVLQHELDGVWPLCKCGCGGKVRFLSGRFMDFVGGHQSIGLKRSEETKKKISLAGMGRKHSEETKKKLANAARKDIEKIKKMHDAVRGKPKTEEHRQKISETRKRLFAEGKLEINRDKVSESMVRKYQEEGFRWAHGHYTSSKTGKTCYYRSSWEHRQMELLDSDPVVEWWEHEPHCIDYYFEDQLRRYLPDFLVRYSDGRRELQEIGVKEMKQDLVRNAAKSEAARRWCDERGYSFRIVSF